jgi:hypothetical protein
MIRYPTAILALRPLEVFVPLASQQSISPTGGNQPATAARIAHTCATIILERVVPTLWVVMPEKALAMIWLAFGCSALADWIA